MGCRYIYSIYDAKSGALVAKGDAAKLVGLGLFRDAGVLSTSYRKNRECKKPRKYRIEREKVVKTFVMTTPQKALRSMYIYSCYDARDKLLGRGTGAGGERAIWQRDQHLLLLQQGRSKRQTGGGPDDTGERDAGIAAKAKGCRAPEGGAAAGNFSPNGFTVGRA